ncbi:hypothetical protein WR25_09946 [Diploscapter pachys]|uniref:Solute carrier organic anion transporter family member n=1 Tax=Diploscapter pachys TaxID=2018661 RepID=A0A2A2J246_9BILA|nr:hypothetical protein WR25_09946 [Diploscapter pachys]
MGDSEKDASDADTRSCPGDLSRPVKTTKWSHSRQFSQGVPPRNFERPPRRAGDKKWQEKQNALIEQEMNVLQEESLCGIGKWRPAWLQFLGNRKWMIILLCYYCMIQGMIVNGLVPSSISSIERRFKLSTSSMGRIVQFYDFAFVLFCIPVSYFGGRHSKPAVLAGGLCLIALGSFVFSSPHLLSGSYSASHANHTHGTCSAISISNSSLPNASPLIRRDCNEEQISQQPGSFRYMFLFCLAHFLHGIGATPLFTIGVSYIDENVGPALSSLFVGIFYSFGVFGPAAGFLTAGLMLRYHTDFWHLPPDQILKTRLRDAAQQKSRRTPECCGMPATSKTAAVGAVASDQEESSLLYASITVRGRGPLWYKLWLDIRHIPIAIYKILTNGPFMIITLAMAIDSLVVTGASSFMSKYLERQFSVAPSKANVLIGCIMVPMAGLGCMLSGYIVQYFRLNCVKMLRLAISLLFASLLLTPMYRIYCPHDRLIGVDSLYPDNHGHIPNGNETFDYDVIELRDTCNSHCECDETQYRPVCAELSDGRQFTYYSPCYAGCEQPYASTTKVYTHCHCVPMNTLHRPHRVTKGVCESKCRGLLGFLILFAPLSFCTFAVAVPIVSVILRTVDYNERSFALGIQWILVRVIGTIPAPVLFGWMFDVSCIKYQSESNCNNPANPATADSGNCLLYSNRLLADLFMTFSIIGQAVSMVILICVLIFYDGVLQQNEPLEEHAMQPIAESPGQPPAKQVEASLLQ